MYTYPEINWNALRKYRTERVKDIMTKANIDALVLTGHDNIRYATDFGTFLICESFDWYAAIVTKEGESYLFIPYVDKVIKNPLPKLPWIREYIPTPSWVSSITQQEIWVEMLTRKLRALKAGRVGVDSSSACTMYCALSGVANGLVKGRGWSRLEHQQACGRETWLRPGDRRHVPRLELASRMIRRFVAGGSAEDSAALGSGVGVGLYGVPDVECLQIESMKRRARVSL